ncbi:MAG: DUF3343 domain-containing protein [Oscillospiraceae bacterium]
MVYYLIICHSLTSAQRTASVLEQAGISANVLRTPTSIAGKGCSYAVKLSQRRLPDALVLLKRAQLEPRRVYLSTVEGGYEEARL